MSDRQNLRDEFLKDNGWGDVDCPLLAGDASFRKYYRLSKGDETVVLMDAPPPTEDVRPFINIAEFLTDNGFSAPQILAHDKENGFLLLEDFGDHTYTQLLAQGEDERALYRLAINVLIDLHKDIKDLPDDIDHYDIDLLHRECLLLPEWWMTSQFGKEAVNKELIESYKAVWEPLFERVQTDEPNLVLRDFHVDNLLVLEGRPDHQRCGLLDFQDAVAGNGLYDVVSLLEDARRDINPALVEEMKMRYMAAFEERDHEACEEEMAILAAQRHAKVIGIFVRLCVRDGKDAYLEHIPRVWKLFMRALRHPVMHEVKAWVDKHIPKEIRGVPTCLKK